MEIKRITIKDNKIPNIVSLIKLYKDAGWSNYIKEVDLLEKAVNNSLKVWTAWDNNELVGLARVIGDNYTIIYIQDILILQEYQNKGLGSKLLKIILTEYQSVRQVVLLTDNKDKTINYYKKNGLVPTSKYNVVAFMKQ